MNDIINQAFDQATEKPRKSGENIEELPKTVACLVNGKNELKTLQQAAGNLRP